MAQENDGIDGQSPDVCDVEGKEADANLKVVIPPGADLRSIRRHEQRGKDIEQSERQEGEHETCVVPLNLTVGPEEPPIQRDEKDEEEDPTRVDPISPTRLERVRDTSEETQRGKGANE